MNQAQPQTVYVQEPREITRLVYANAIRAAISDGERNQLHRALAWYELWWRTQDAQGQQQQRAAQEQAQGEPRKFSAVDEDEVTG